MISDINLSDRLQFYFQIFLVRLDIQNDFFGLTDVSFFLARKLEVKLSNLLFSFSILSIKERLFNTASTIPVKVFVCSQSLKPKTQLLVKCSQLFLAISYEYTNNFSHMSSYVSFSLIGYLGMIKNHSANWSPLILKNQSNKESNQ